jgi:hypothetical protein
MSRMATSSPITLPRHAGTARPLPRPGLADQWRELRAVVAVRLPWLTRPRRILLILTLVWVLHMLDLRFTLLESLKTHFVELNPVAARLLDWSMGAVVAYKLGLLGAGTAILLILRRHEFAERGTWFLFVVHLYLAVRWHMYYVVAPAEEFLYLPPLLPGS